jgi:DNA-directed RNA polymerase subunit RPC12/RpoP
MTLFKCIGCNREFSKQRAYSAHSHYCKYKVALKGKKQLEKRKDNVELRAMRNAARHEVDEEVAPVREIFNCISGTL